MASADFPGFVPELHDAISCNETWSTCHSRALQIPLTQNLLCTSYLGSMSLKCLAKKLKSKKSNYMEALADFRFSSVGLRGMD